MKWSDLKVGSVVIDNMSRGSVYLVVAKGAGTRIGWLQLDTGDYVPAVDEAIAGVSDDVIDGDDWEVIR